MYDALIIGADHHNTLSLIRSLGYKNINFYLIIHSKRKIGLCDKSKYIKNNYEVVENTYEAIINSIKKFSVANKKKVPIIIGSDLAAYVVDDNLHKLSSDFWCPNIKNEEKAICHLMDKYEQYLLAKQNGILVAETVKLSLSENVVDGIKNLKFPIIIKPYISAFGSKSDIIKCNTLEEYNKATDKLREKKYDLILVQEYIEHEYEYLSMGAILGKHDKTCITEIKLKRFPIVGGSTAYGKTISTPLEIEKFVTILQEMKYIGLFDIEFFLSNGKYYLNEVNFRNSGANFASLEFGVDSAYLLFLKQTGKDIKCYQKSADANKYFMVLQYELSLLKSGEISIFNFLKDLIKTSSFDVLCKKDILCGVSYYLSFLKSKMFGKKR